MAKSPAAQVGGGSAAYQQNRPSGYQAARQAELAKRSTWRQEDGRYLEASVLANVPADEYVAMFSVSMEGKTLAAARSAMDATVKKFTDGMAALRILGKDSYVDFVAQNRIYGYEDAGNSVVREVVAGFEVKKNIAFRYRDKEMLDPLIEAAAKAEVFDLVKVDYIVKDHAKVQAALMEEAATVIKRRAAEIEKLFDQGSIRVSGVMPPQFSVYYPSEMYDAYQAQESESLYGYRPNQVIQLARKPRSFYYHGLEGKDFDTVLGPAPVEPMVQFTVYVRVKY
ncbi:MAG: hypothetical protein HONBIEJF_00577 [Fimbriimonadaceae bacterium]|nr:hypothetical protein [Fimbriimonadaceae bacterium]